MEASIKRKNIVMYAIVDYIVPSMTAEFIILQVILQDCQLICQGIDGVVFKNLFLLPQSPGLRIGDDYVRQHHSRHVERC